MIYLIGLFILTAYFVHGGLQSIRTKVKNANNPVEAWDREAARREKDERVFR